MFSKVVHIAGLVFIILLSATCILVSHFQRDIKTAQTYNQDWFYKLTTYPTYFEDIFYDKRMNLSLHTEKKDDRMLLLEIDDDSIEKIGRYPWTRTVWAKVMDKLNHFGAKVVAFDVFFEEEEKACNSVSPDVIFSESLKNFQASGDKFVILPYKIERDYYPKMKIPDAMRSPPDALFDYMLDAKERSTDIKLKLNYISKGIYPVEKLEKAGVGLAHIQATSDEDGVFRHYQLAGLVEDFYFPAFSLLAYQKYTDKKPILIVENLDDIQLELAAGNMHLNIKGESKVRWVGGKEAFHSLKIWELLEAKENDPKISNLIKDKIVFVGSTAFAAHDLRHTPVDSQLPGVYFHMNMTNMLLDGNFFKPKDVSTKLSWWILFGGTAIMIIVMLFGHALLDLSTAVILTGGIFIFDTYYLIPQGYEVKLFFCLFSIGTTYSWTTFLHFYSTSKEKKYIRGTFSRFVAPAIVDKMLNNPEMVKVGGEKRDITVFFSDVRDFTTISEKLTPEELSTCLNQYMGVMTDILFDNMGTLDKYIGDAIVGYWNAPADVEHHAYQAVKTSLIMIEKLPDVNAKFTEQGFPEFKHGIGLNTGVCSVGNMGSDKIFSYTALGDNMNLGARIESLCKKYGVQLNVSEYTINAMTEEQRKEFTYRRLDKVAVKGKSEPVTIYEVFHSFHMYMKDQESLGEYNKAFDLRLEQKFPEALSIFEALVAKYPEDKASTRFVADCKHMMEFPPGDDWDGVTIMTEK